MKQEKTNLLTERGLIAELKTTGFGEVTKRQLAAWRKNGLLPTFDLEGEGLGRGKGRTEGGWTEPVLVIDQAKRLQRFRILGIPLNNFHVYSWILGYRIDPELLRSMLLKPLERTKEMVIGEAAELRQKWQLNTRNEGIIEDVIDDAVVSVFPTSDDSIISLESLEVLLNLFFNDSYSFDVLDLDSLLWELNASHCRMEKLCREPGYPFEPNGEEVARAPQTPTLEFVLTNANFIQRHFSLAQLETAIQSFSTNDLKEVEADLHVATKVASAFGRAIEPLLNEIKRDHKHLREADDVLPLLLRLAQLLVYADFSLRRNGFANFLNNLREKMDSGYLESFIDKLGQELEQSTPLLSQNMVDGLEMTKKLFGKLIESSSVG